MMGTILEETQALMLRSKNDEIATLNHRIVALSAKCADRIEVHMQLGSRIGKLEHQRNEARRKHGVLKKKVRQIVFVQKAAITANARLTCERALLDKELGEARVELAALRDRVAAFEQAQEKRIDRAREAHEKSLAEFGAGLEKVPA